MSQRKISKKLRFLVFARDNFACRYCGAQSDKAQLVIDHVIPVCQGGGNEIGNLVTACFACNSGKGAETVPTAIPEDPNRLKISQEMQEQIAAMTAARQAMEARRVLEKEVKNYFCAMRETQSMQRTSLTILTKLVLQHGVDNVFKWIEMAVSRLPPSRPDSDISKYVCGIRRKLMQDGNL